MDEQIQTAATGSAALALGCIAAVGLLGVIAIAAGLVCHFAVRAYQVGWGWLS